jgi:hypothetical protein
LSGIAEALNKRRVCAVGGDGLLPAGSRRLSLRPRSHARWRGSSGLSHVKFSLRQLDNRNTNQPGGSNPSIRIVRRLQREAGQPQGILETCYELAMCRRSSLERGSPRRKPGHAVTKPAHETLLTGVFSPCLLPCALIASYLRSAKAGDDRPRLSS